MLLSTQVYIIKDGQWLMLLRNKKKNDVNHNKWIAVGGKKESSETIEECAVREMYEETGLKCEKAEYKGLVHFEYENNEPEDIYVYTCTRFSGILHGTEEGTLRWIDESELLNLELWEGDRIFLKRMLEHSPDPFEITLRYDSGGSLIKVREERDI